MKLLILMPLLASQIYMGRVVDAYTQKPIPGVAIAAKDGWAETSEDGSYYLESEGEAFLIQKEGYWTSRVSREQLLHGVALLPKVKLAPRRAMLLYSLVASEFATPQIVKDGVMLNYVHPFDNWLIDARLDGGTLPLSKGQTTPFGIGGAAVLHRWAQLPNLMEFYVGPSLHLQFGDVVDSSSVEPHLRNGYLRLNPGLEANWILRPVSGFGFQWRTRLGYYPFAFSLGSPAFTGNVHALDGFSSVEVALGRFVPTVGIGYHLLAGPQSQLRAIYRFSLGSSILL